MRLKFPSIQDIRTQTCSSVRQTQVETEQFVFKNELGYIQLVDSRRVIDINILTSDEKFSISQHEKN
jgi:hypothetical protein